MVHEVNPFWLILPWTPMTSLKSVEAKVSLTLRMLTCRRAVRMTPELRMKWRTAQSAFGQQRVNSWLGLLGQSEA